MRFPFAATPLGTACIYYHAAFPLSSLNSTFSVKIWKPPERLPNSLVFLFRVVDQAVAPIVSAVHHGKASAVVLVTEREEIVLQQVHLHDRFFAGHGLEVEALDFLQAEIVFLRLRNEAGLLLHRAGEGILTQATGEPGLVPAP